MARRKSSTFEDAVDLVAMLPWWAGVVIAVVSHLLLRGVANSPADNPAAIGHMGLFVATNLYRTFATIGQYLIPFMALLGAFASFLGRRKRQGLVAKAQAHSGGGNAGDALNGMSWQEFEQLVGEAFRRQGYTVNETGGSQADGGVDLVLRRDGERHLVQCKQWRAYRVGVGVVRELYGVMAAEGAAGGYVVTSGTFTDEAKLFAQGRNVELIEGPALMRLIQRARAQHGVRNDDSATGVRPARGDAEPEPTCAACGAAMVLRTAQKGAKAGHKFWGCSSFPSCRSTKAAD